MTKLERLSLFSTLITDDGVTDLTNLTYLNLVSDTITDRGIQTLTNLRTLHFVHNTISDKGIRNLTNLTHISLSNQMSQSALLALPLLEDTFPSLFD